MIETRIELVGETLYDSQVIIEYAIPTVHEEMLIYEPNALNVSVDEEELIL